MKAFENFDWDAFWYNDSNSYKLIYFNGGVLKEQDVKRVEDEFGYKLPDSYITLSNPLNGGLLIKLRCLPAMKIISAATQIDTCRYHCGAFACLIV